MRWRLISSSIVPPKQCAQKPIPNTTRYSLWRLKHWPINWFISKFSIHHIPLGVVGLVSVSGSTMVDMRVYLQPHNGQDHTPSPRYEKPPSWLCSKPHKLHFLITVFFTSHLPALIQNFFALFNYLGHYPHFLNQSIPLNKSIWYIENTPCPHLGYMDNVVIDIGEREKSMEELIYKI